MASLIYILLGLILSIFCVRTMARNRCYVWGSFGGFAKFVSAGVIFALSVVGMVTVLICGV